MASGKEKNEIEEIYEKYYKDVYRFGSKETVI